MTQQPDDLERQLHELENIPVPGSLLQNIQARIGQLTPEWGARQYQLGRERRLLCEGDRGKHLVMAIGHFQNALHVYTTEAFPLLRVKVLYDAGGAYRDLSDLPERDRLIALEKAVTQYKEARNIVSEHVVKERRLADTWRAKLDQAISECYQQRIQELKHRADVVKAVADVLLHLKDQRVDALANYKQALHLYRLVESRLDEAIMLKEIGDIYCSLEYMDEAIQHYEQALACFEQMDHRHDVATVLQAMGDMAQARHDDAAARQYYQRALDLFVQVGDGFSEAAMLAAMGTQVKEVDLYRKVGEANLSYIEFKSFDEHVAVLDRPHQQESADEMLPDQATQDTQEAEPPPEEPERDNPITYARTVFEKQGKRARWLFPVLFVVIMLIAGVIAVTTQSGTMGGVYMEPMQAATRMFTGAAYNSCDTASNQLPASAHGIGAVQTSMGECIGLSDGRVVFDVNQPGRTDSTLKLQATEDLAKEDGSAAIVLLQQAVQQDPSDAEARIYLENLQVLDSRQPYITLVVGTKITGEQIDLTGERRILQGAYIAQWEYNQRCLTEKCPQLRILIANSGNDANNAKEVVSQIVQAAHYDRSIIGVEGWSTSQDSVEAVSTLRAAHIPMVSSAASSDLLTGISPYFFRVAPPDNSQGELEAQYAMNRLHAQRIALFVDSSNAYSASLAGAFKQGIRGESVAVVQTYTVGSYAGDKALVRANLQEIANYHPDLIFFAGYSEDAGTLLEELSTNKQLAQVPVMGGDDLYNLVGDTGQNIAGLDHLIFTAFASPDEWRYVDPAAQEPPFFQEYGQIFAAGGSQSDRDAPTGEVILSYDAMRVLLQASQTAIAHKKAALTSEDLEQALKSITGAHAFQGISGQIAFGQDGNPQDKAVVMLSVDKEGQTHILTLMRNF